MSTNTNAPDTLCPIARAETVVGDRWTVLVLRELFMGSHRYDEIQAQTGGTPQMVATRLKNLEAEGMVERRLYNERPPRYEYHLSEKGRAFYPVVLALRAWGETWCKSPQEGLAVVYTHTTCGVISSRSSTAPVPAAPSPARAARQARRSRRLARGHAAQPGSGRGPVRIDP